MNLRALGRWSVLMVLGVGATASCTRDSADSDNPNAGGAGTSAGRDAGSGGVAAGGAKGGRGPGGSDSGGSTAAGRRGGAGGSDVDAGRAGHANGESGAAGGAGAGAGGESGAAAGMGGEGNGNRVPFGTCPDPTVLAPGIEGCADDTFKHRVTAESCPLPERNPAGEPRQVDDDLQCLVDDDCDSESYCLYFSYGSYNGNRCVTPCVEDADCGPGRICSCEDRRRSVEGAVAEFGRCVDATCTTDDDCGEGSLCRAPIQFECQSPTREPTYPFACQRSEDECSGPSECPSPTDVPLGEYGPGCLPGMDGEPWSCGGVLIEC